MLGKALHRAEWLPREHLCSPPLVKPSASLHPEVVASPCIPLPAARGEHPGPALSLVPLQPPPGLPYSPCEQRGARHGPLPLHSPSNDTKPSFVAASAVVYWCGRWEPLQQQGGGTGSGAREAPQEPGTDFQPH